MIDCLTILGGDRRQFYLAKQLQSCGFRVLTHSVTGLPDSEPALQDVLASAQAVILPMPALIGNQRIRHSQGSEITLSDVMSYSPESAVLFGGGLGSAKESLRSHFRRVYDFSDSEALSVANTVPTAEGAIQLAMEQLPIIIHGSRCLVIGYGRIGKVLSRLLKELGAEVTVSTRKSSDAAWVRAAGLQSDLTGQYLRGLAGYDCIFNTVPAPVLGAEHLRAIRPDCVILDLASGCGGLSPDVCSTSHPNYMQALALPGKVAPASSAELLKNEILDALTVL